MKTQAVLLVIADLIRNPGIEAWMPGQARHDSQRRGGNQRNLSESRYA
jgi:hypothetical protein